MCVAHSGDVLSGRAVLLREHRFVDQLSAALPTRKQNLKPTAGVWQFISIQVVQQNKPAKSIFFMLFLAGVWELKIGGNLKFFADLTLMSITDTVNLYVKVNFNLTSYKCCVLLQADAKLTGPMMCVPRMTSVVLSASTLTNPSGSPLVFAREFARNGNLPTLYARPWKK